MTKPNIQSESEKSTKSTKSAVAKPVVHTTAQSQADSQTGGASPAISPQATSTTASTSPAPLSFAARVSAAVAHVEQAKSLLGLDAALSNTQIRRAVKFKKGGEQHVPTLAGLSAKYGLEVPSRPTSDMIATLDKATQLEPARAAIGELSKIVDDSYFGYRSDSWRTATSLYSMMKKGAPSDPNLASALAPLQEYFAYRHPLIAAEHPKRSPAKAATKEQKKVAKRIAKLNTQLAELQSAMTSSAPAAEPAPAQPAVATSPAPATRAS